MGAAGLGLLPAAKIETAGRRDKPAKDGKDRRYGTGVGFCAQRRPFVRKRTKLDEITRLLPKVYTPVTRFNDRFGIFQGKAIVYRIAYFLGESL
ncbi:MAG TPA: hypothetical protein VGI28_08840 [Stellaceae bacterium]